MTRRLFAATKFSVPALPGRYVVRERLHALLDAGAAVPLTVVVGVPGAGKSVMLTSWMHDRPDLRSIWVSCDGRDADPVTFWHALCAALTQEWPERWLDVVDLLAEPEPDLEDVAIATVNELAGLGEPVVIVIDDLQFAPAAASSLVTLVERLPAAHRVVVGSRTEPQLALHRLRARGQLLEVRDPDLRLTRDEVARVLREFEIALTESEIELLTTHTEGWMVGVQMAAVSLRDQSDRDRFLADLAKTPRAITDFLGSEVLDRQPNDIREFLLSTSVLDVLDPGSCAAVTGWREAVTMLERVQERNLFLIELDRDTYRYHHLFAELLRHHLGAEDPERAQELHRRAASYFVEIDDPENAIGQLLAAGLEDEAFEVLRTNLVSSFYRGDGGQPRRLFSRFEKALAAVDPAPLADLALAVAASGPTGSVERWIARADAHASDLDEANRSRLELAHAVVALRQGEPVDIERALSRCPAPQDLPDYVRLGYIPSILARGRLWSGDLPGTRQIYERTLRDSDPLSPRYVGMACGLAWLACVEGHLTEADDTGSRALADAESMGLGGNPITVEAICARGRVAFERGELAVAERLLEQCISLSENVRPAFAVEGQLVLSRVWLAEGLVAEALDGVDRARALLPRDSTSPLLALCDAMEGRSALEAGDLARADACRRRLDTGNRATILAARIHLARGDVDEASAELVRCEPETLRQRLDVALLEARIANGLGSSDCESRIIAALDLARPEGFVVAVTDEIFELRPRVEQLLRSRRVGDYEQTLLDRLASDLPLATPRIGAGGPLSDRELTVLRYLSSRLTNTEIATEIFVSTNTVKTHVSRIYRKLGVSSRTDAIAEARRLGVM